MNRSDPGSAALAYVTSLLRWRVALLVLFAVLLGVAGVFASKLGNDNSLHVWFQRDDPLYLTYEQFLADWGSDEIVLVAFRSPDLFTATRLRWLSDLTERIAALPNIRKVTSLTNVEDLRGVEGGLVAGPLLGDIPDDPGVLSEMRARALRNPLLRGFLLAEDGLTTAIEARIERGDVDSKREMEDALRSLLAEEQHRQGFPLHVTGVPIMDAAFDRYSETDGNRAFPLMLVVLLGVLFVANPSARGVLVPLAATVVPMVLTIGLFAASGETMNMLSQMIFIVLLAIAVADSVHLVEHHQAELASGALPRPALAVALGRLALPCLFTSLTTAVGFGSFFASRIPVLRTVGLWTAIGILIAFAVAMTLVPILLSFASAAAARPRRGTTSLLTRVASWNENRGRVIVAAAIALVVWSIAGAARVRIETDNLSYFPHDSEIRTASDFVEEHLTGSVPVEVVVRGPADSLKDPRVLRRMEKAAQELRALPETTKTLSMVDLVEEMNVALHDGDRQWAKIPETRRAVAQYLLLYELSGGEELADFVQTDYSSARLTGFLRQMTSERLREVVQSVNVSVGEGFPPGVEARVEGVANLWAWFDTYLLESQISSFGLALAGVSAMMLVCLRSIRLAALSLVPNLLPVLAMFGFMGWSGIALDSGTVLVAAVALGLAVDNTIHYLVRFRAELAATGDDVLAARRVMQQAGRPILESSLVLLLGFLVTTVSSFRPMVYFGLLTSFTLAVGLLADLLLLPVLVLWWKPLAVQAPCPTASVHSGMRRPPTKPATSD